MAKNFAKGIMASEDVQSKLLTGVFYDSSNARAELPDGSLVVVDTSAVEGAEEYNTRYNVTSVHDLNRVRVKYPTAATAKVCVADYVNRSQGLINGVLYREGIKTYGMACPADDVCRIRVLDIYDGYWTDADNFESAPTVGKFAIPTANKGTYTPADAIDTAKYCWQIIESRPVIEGMMETGTQYYIRLVNMI